MAGPAPSGVDPLRGGRKADYKEMEALKSCSSEFRHYPLVWSYNEGGSGCNPLPPSIFLIPNVSIADAPGAYMHFSVLRHYPKSVSYEKRQRISA